MTRSILFLLALVCVSTSCSKQQISESTNNFLVSGDTVKLTSEAIKGFNISTTTVKERLESPSITTTGEIKADDNRVFHINSLSNGRVITDNVILGDVIHAGKTLAVVQNLDLAKIYGDYIHQSHQNEIDVHLEQTRLALAQKNYDRLKTMFKEGIAAEKDMIKAESDKKLSEETLRGLKEHGVHIREEAKAMLAAYGIKLSFARSEYIKSDSPIIAPRSGVIIKKNVTVGDVVTNTEHYM